MKKKINFPDCWNHHFWFRIQGEEFEKEIAPCTKIIYFDVSDETMTERLINRGKSSGRVDDNVETIKKRLNTFHQHSKPVIEAYSSKCSCVCNLVIFTLSKMSNYQMAWTSFFRFQQNATLMTSLLMFAKPWILYNYHLLNTKIMIINFR